MLRIKALAFEVDRERSALLAYVPQEAPGVESPGRLRWSLEVYCLDQENEQGISAPGLYANELTRAVSDWRRLEGVMLQDDDQNSLAAYFSDGLINERTISNRVRFLSRQGSLFSIEWHCMAHLFTNEDAPRPSPLQLNADIAFRGVHLWWVKADAQGFATAEALVGKHFELTGLEEPESAGPFHIVFPPSTV